MWLPMQASVLMEAYDSGITLEQSDNTVSLGNINSMYRVQCVVTFLLFILAFVWCYITWHCSVASETDLYDDSFVKVVETVNCQSDYIYFILTDNVHKANTQVKLQTVVVDNYVDFNWTVWIAWLSGFVCVIGVAQAMKKL